MHKPLFISLPPLFDPNNITLPTSPGTYRFAAKKPLRGRTVARPRRSNSRFSAIECRRALGATWASRSSGSDRKTVAPTRRSAGGRAARSSRRAAAPNVAVLRRLASPAAASPPLPSSPSSDASDSRSSAGSSAGTPAGRRLGCGGGGGGGVVSSRSCWRPLARACALNRASRDCRLRFCWAACLWVGLERCVR